jgi:LmbE family N-acetylglucosaminyl deacetylase
MDSKNSKKKHIAVIVAHPDDETLWAGGTILSHPLVKWYVVCLSRAKDENRAYRFYNALKDLKSEGIMGDMDDGPDQIPLMKNEAEKIILELLPSEHFDLIISHNPSGEYTRHLRHEETGEAVIRLWQAGKIFTDELWTFAYEDGNKEYFPRAVENATICRTLSKKIWQKKYSLITETYGFEKHSFEAQTTPRIESFHQFKTADAAVESLNELKNIYESTGII